MGALGQPAGGPQGSEIPGKLGGNPPSGGNDPNVDSGSALFPGKFGNQSGGTQGVTGPIGGFAPYQPPGSTPISGGGDAGGGGGGGKLGGFDLGPSPYGTTTAPTTPGWWTSAAPEWTDPASIWDPAARQIAGTNPALDQAAALAGTLGDAPSEYSTAWDLIQQMANGGSGWLEKAGTDALAMRNPVPEWMRAGQLLDEMGEVSKRKVTGEGLETDPAVLAAMARFDSAINPMIENQAALAGLGRSTALTNATAARKAETMLPLIQDFFGREERGIDRELGALGQRFQGEQGLGDRTYGQLGDQFSAFMGLDAADREKIGIALSNVIGLGDRSYGRRGDQLGALASLGDYGRQMGQEQADANQEDYLRRAALFESYLNAPFGMLPGTIGGDTDVTSEKKA